MAIDYSTNETVRVSLLHCNAEGWFYHYNKELTMHPIQRRYSVSTLVFGLIGAAMFSSAAYAAGAASDIEAQYKKEMAVCNSGQSNQDKASCVREAGAARDEARRNRLSDASSPSQYEKNALDRCNALPGGDKDDCIARMKQGTVSGSPEGGGVIRELRTTVPATPSR